MTATLFVDTNVFVYARDASEGEKQSRAEAWVRHLWQAGAGRISYQVLTEYYVTVTRKLTPGLTRDRARRDVQALLAWRPLEIQEVVLAAAFHLEDAHSISWWDALIVAAAETLGCSHLLSEDLAEGARYGTVEVVNPFHQVPVDLGL
jgi:predicted nucleic acid-binding protein